MMICTLTLLFLSLKDLIVLSRTETCIYLYCDLVIEQGTVQIVLNYKDWCHSLLCSTIGVQIKNLKV
jgi:hypothetical protein